MMQQQCVHVCQLLRAALFKCKTTRHPERDMLWALADALRLSFGWTILCRGPNDGAAALTVDESIGRFVKAYNETTNISDAATAFVGQCLALLVPTSKVSVERVLVEIELNRLGPVTDLPSLVKLLADCEDFSKNPRAFARDWTSGLKNHVRTMDEFHALTTEAQAAVMLRFGFYAMKEQLEQTGLRLYDTMTEIMRMDAFRPAAGATQPSDVTHSA